MSTCTALGVADFVRYDDPWVPYFPPLSFFFNDTATTEIYTLSLHDALPISTRRPPSRAASSTDGRSSRSRTAKSRSARRDRKSTRLNSSHGYISYAVFCLKKKKGVECSRTLIS